MGDWMKVDWLNCARAVATALSVAVAPTLSLAQEAAEKVEATPEQIEAARAHPPRFADAWVAYQEGDETYFDCVEEKKRTALDEMWRRGAPLEAAIYEVSVAYRQCPGFDAMWARIYFSGFDAPEHWIALEIQAAKAAILAKDEVEARALDSAARLFGQAAHAAGRVGKAKRSARIAARDALLRYRYVVAALRPDQALPPDIEEIVQEYGKYVRSILPESAGEDLTKALELAEKRDTAESLADYVVRSKR